jgi:hypothetical protein
MSTFLFMCVGVLIGELITVLPPYKRFMERFKLMLKKNALQAIHEVYLNK